MISFLPSGILFALRGRQSAFSVMNSGRRSKRPLNCRLYLALAKAKKTLMCYCMCFAVADISITVAVYLLLLARKSLVLICRALTCGLYPNLNQFHSATGLFYFEQL